jgi:hypothetical protein
MWISQAYWNFGFELTGTSALYVSLLRLGNLMLFTFAYLHLMLNIVAVIFAGDEKCQEEKNDHDDPGVNHGCCDRYMTYVKQNRRSYMF